MEVRALWAGIMILLYSVLPGTYAVIAASVGRAFGPLYFAPNLGLIFSATLAYFSIIIVLSQVNTDTSLTALISPLPVRLRSCSTCWATQGCSSWRGPRPSLACWSQSSWGPTFSTRGRGNKPGPSEIQSERVLLNKQDGAACSLFISI